MPKDIYVLGTGLSHDGSAVILKNGEVAIAIEKERLSRIKHDGGNDSLAIQYCLDALGITMNDIALAVQCENFVVPERNQFQGERIFKDYPAIPLHSISHHLAHAYSTIGTSPFSTFNILVIDGCGSPYQQCTEDLFPTLEDLSLPEDGPSGLICEKDSFYHYDGENLKVLFKDFSEMDIPRGNTAQMPTTKHSVGGFYAFISQYCFGNMSDAGKLMGLAPFGKNGGFKASAFHFHQGRIFVKDDWKELLKKPALDYQAFQTNFQYYADIAFWAQQEVEKAISYIVQNRTSLHKNQPLCYSGGVALNAVANAKMIQNGLADQLYIEPAAADNGLALGCAYYGWLELLKGKRKKHSGNTCFGISYSDHDVAKTLKNSFPNLSVTYYENRSELLISTAKLISEGKTIGWFQGRSEFGPRALGCRSILASPFEEGMQLHINQNIKFREDFRPFAPAVLAKDVRKYFKHGFESPYMILVDEVKEEWASKLKAVSHVNGSARVQTVDGNWNNPFYELLKELKAISGHGMVLNTSFNKKGQPIVETPEQAIALFTESALDVLAIENYIIKK
tara:strand:- start:279 stop:1973 length:1695 start_codon:yes stop_codon:yes gene_type:complete